MKKVNVLALPKEDLEGYKSPKNRVEAYLNLQDAIKIRLKKCSLFTSLKR